MPSRERLEQLRSIYKPGTRIELIQMEDSQAPPVGTRGRVWGIDDAGNILMRWDTGSGLSLIPGVDHFRVVTEETGG